MNQPAPLPLDTQACEDRDFAEWHRGCPWCAVWLLRAEAPAVQQQLERARAALAPWLLPRYARQPHVTLAYRGLMAGREPHPQAEFGQPQWQRDVQALQAARLQPFALQIEGVGSFTTVPYLAVAPNPVLAQLHNALAAHAPSPDWRYVPHVTIGHYARQLPMHQVMAQLQDSGAGDPVVQVPVQALWLARYRTQDIAGSLRFEGRFDLRTQAFEAQPGALLAL